MRTRCAAHVADQSVVILEAGARGRTSGLLPNERVHLDLRQEGDRFLELMRVLNQTAVAEDDGHEHDERVQGTLGEMRTSVERMAELAG